MYQVLARKLRPTQFEDVVGQDHITKSLQNSILNNKIGHAYIFSGTRGVGKTTVARIFAKAIRCETPASSGDSCGECKACIDFDTGSSLDVLEIDGASNNSVDDIRDLVLNVQYLPTFGKYKVYIIDEVHMLSTSAFNALLKTLEEPPAHVVFIFATTEPNKLLDTVLSRCQRFDFLSASLKNLNDLLLKISKQENIIFEDDSLIAKICEAGNESFRDTLSLLDQVLSFSGEEKISEDILVISLGLARSSAVKELVSSILLCDMKTSSKIFRGLLNENVSLENISRAILDKFYDILQDRDKFPEVGELNSAEVYWVYETFAKELNWNLESLSPKKTTELLIQKICLRRQIFKTQINVESSNIEKKTQEIVEPQLSEENTQPVNQDDKKSVENEEIESSLPEEITEKKIVSESIRDIVEKLAEAQKITEEKALENHTVEETTELSSEAIPLSELEVPPEDEEKTWLNFISFLAKISPAQASTLEQGNLISPLVFDAETVRIALGFTKASEVFLDHLQEEEAYGKLLKNIGLYFKCSIDNIDLVLELVNSDVEKFTSLAQINQKKDDDIKEEKRKSFLTDPLILEAEKLFNSSVDKVILEKNK